MAKKTGRPVGSRRLTNDVRDKIINGIRLGLTHERSAQLAGINVRTFYLWRQKGLAGKAPVYVRFVQALKKAEVEGEAAAINEIVKAAKSGTWQAAAWLLERRHPDRWARIQKLEINWQNELYPHIQDGTLSFGEVKDELGDELARELFISAGVAISED